MMVSETALPARRFWQLRFLATSQFPPLTLLDLMPHRIASRDSQTLLQVHAAAAGGADDTAWLVVFLLYMQFLHSALLCKFADPAGGACCCGGRRG